MMMWTWPSIMEEREEIKRQSSELNIDWRQVMCAIRQAEIVELDDDAWMSIQNTDSNDPELTLDEIKTWTHRDVDRILSATVLPIPIILVYNNILFCVSGNTRLCVCKVLGTRPHILR